ncbi:hypothetical protein ACFTAO_21415 [Paenibacillus rhizoplanae]
MTAGSTRLWSVPDQPSPIPPTGNQPSRTLKNKNEQNPNPEDRHPEGDRWNNADQMVEQLVLVGGSNRCQQECCNDRKPRGDYNQQ